MITRRLTRIEKIEILEEFRSGMSANNLAKKYNCSSNTINRTVKTMLSNEEYNSLKEERSKIKRKKLQVSSSELSNQNYEELEVDNIPSKYPLNKKIDNFDPQQDENDEGEKNKSDSEDVNYSPFEKENYENNLQEIAPLISDIGR